jgi:MFS family permease
MNAIAQVVGSLLMYGIARNTGLPIAPWRVMFIVCGAMTVAIGIVFFFAMPSGPEDAWFLNQREKELLVVRMAERHEGGDHKDFSLAQLKEALLDYKGEKRYDVNGAEREVIFASPSLPRRRPSCFCDPLTIAIVFRFLSELHILAFL